MLESIRRLNGILLGLYAGNAEIFDTANLLIFEACLAVVDKAVRAAERRVAEVTRAAGEQTAQAERELADAAQTVDDLEEKLVNCRTDMTG